MSTVLWAQFLPSVMPYVPDVADFVAEDAVRASCIDFCERTRFWQEDLEPIAVMAGVPNYEVDVDSGAKLIEVSEAWLDTQLLIPKTAEELTRIYRGTDWRSSQGAPRYITRIIPTELVLVPTPLVTLGALNVRASMAPTRASLGVDSSVYEDYLDTIAYGARARLYATPKQPYFDFKAAEVYEKKFRIGVADARVKINRGMSRSATQVEFQRVV